MKFALSRGAALFAALALTVFGQESTTTDNTPATMVTRTPIDPAFGPTLAPGSSPDAGLLEPGPKITPEDAPFVVPHPLALGDCAGDGWRNFTIPRFKDRGACESWIREHLDPDAGPRLFLFPAPDPSLSGPNRRSPLPLRA